MEYQEFLKSKVIKAMQMGRKSVSIELNSEYYKDGLFYLHALNHKMNVPTLFDVF